LNPRYPLTPKSTTHLERGQFWPIQLSDGRFGAGCVVGEAWHEGKKNSRLFIAGVVDWVGESSPSPEDLIGCQIHSYAFAHIKCITEYDAAIFGKAELALPSIPEAAESLSLSTWGYAVPNIICHKLAGLQLTSR
jgi:hypothetical protein